MANVDIPCSSDGTNRKAEEGVKNNFKQEETTGWTCQGWTKKGQGGVPEHPTIYVIAGCFIKVVVLHSYQVSFKNLGGMADQFSRLYCVSPRRGEGQPVLLRQRFVPPKSCMAF